MSCGICDKDLSMAWTDSHGIAQCRTCGAPYRVYHYEAPAKGEEKVRVEKEPELLFAPETLAEDRQCFAETGARLSAVGMGLSFPGGYDVASETDIATVSDWYKARRTA